MWIKSFIRWITQKLPNMVRYNMVNVYGTIAGIFLAILANIITEIHINFNEKIDAKLLSKFIICLILSCILQNLYMKISSIKETADREFGSYLEDCKRKKSTPDKNKKITNFNTIIDFHPYILLYPYIAIALLILYVCIN